MASGVYIIKVGKTKYVGASGDLEIRKQIHLNQLKRGKHYNPGLQKAYNEEQKFRFEVLEECKNYFEKERWWVEKIGIDKLANEVLPDGVGGTPSERMNKKRSDSLKKYYETHDGNKTWLGKKRSEETRKKLREHHNPKSNPKGRVLSEETKRKISESIKKWHQERENAGKSKGIV